MKTFEGQLTTTDEKFCIIISRFNDFIGSKLLSGAVDELKRHGVNDNNIDIVKVPGAFEIPVAAQKFAETGRYMIRFFGSYPISFSNSVAIA